ncbi:thiamine pyrophosphate-binding protein [soil metagenome]
MTAAAPLRTGGQILVDQLRIHGIDQVFCVPGESYLAVLDALHDCDITVTVCRQEGGAAMMAEAHGKLTGRPAACFVTRGPGSTNAMPGIHIAEHDSTPMLMFVGQVDRSMHERGAFQELDYRAVFGSMTKWTVEIDDPARIPELVSRAVHLCQSGRPGPVVLALPEDMLVEKARAVDALPARVPEVHPGMTAMAELQSMLAAAERPLLVLGGSRWTAATVASFERYAAAHDLPVAVAFRRQMLFSHDHDCFAGDLGFGSNPALLEQVRSADLLVLVGTRMAEVPSQGYTLLEVPVPRQRLVHVMADAAELGKVYQPTLSICASPVAFVEALVQLPLPPSAARSATCSAARRSCIAWRDPKPVRTPGRLQMAEVIEQLDATLPADAVLCNGAGNYATWIHRFHRFTTFGTQLAPTSGSMGYGVPAAVGAKRIDPQRTVIAFAGDGCFLMNGQEFATAVQYQLAIIVIVVDNGMLGTIRMHQEREYPGRTVATTLVNPDFAAYARAFGGHGETVESTEQFLPALERARASGLPSILHLLLDAEAITPSTTLTRIRAAALARQAQR